MCELHPDQRHHKRDEIILRAIDCGGGGCENCTFCGLGGGDPWAMYQPLHRRRKGIAEINADYAASYVSG